MTNLASDRPLFHSEADFQHALAWQVHQTNPSLRIRLEYRPPVEKKLYVDIWLENEHGATAIELKYFTRKLDHEIEGEKFALLNQSANDICRFDALKDLQRLENLSSVIPNTSGCFIALTNDPLYWSPSTRAQTIDEAFRLDEGREISGELAWAGNASEGTTRGREGPLVIRDKYTANWRAFSQIDSEKYGELRWLCFKV